MSKKRLITPKEAKALNDAFTERCELISKMITKRPDNRSSWYSLKDLRAYLDYAEAQAKLNGVKMNGIRVYCGAYPEKNGKAGYSTSFIVPTMKRELDGEENGDGSGSCDIPGGDGMNFGGTGIPPGANYPQ